MEESLKIRLAIAKDYEFDFQFHDQLGQAIIVWDESYDIGAVHCLDMVLRIFEAFLSEQQQNSSVIYRELKKWKSELVALGEVESDFPAMLAFLEQHPYVICNPSFERKELLLLKLWQCHRYLVGDK